MSNSLGFAEFKDLWQVLNGWKMTFASYDRDRSGTVEGQELQHAVASMGTGKLTKQPVRHLVVLYIHYIFFVLQSLKFIMKQILFTEIPWLSFFTVNVIYLMYF